MSQIKQRRDGIKQPAAAGGQGRIDPAIHHPGKQRHLVLRKESGHRVVDCKSGFSQRLVEVGDSHAPRFAHRGVPPRQQHRPEVPCASITLISPDEKLPSPDRTVRAIPGAVEDDSDSVAIQTVFSHAGG